MPGLGRAAVSPRYRVPTSRMHRRRRIRDASARPAQSGDVRGRPRAAARPGSRRPAAPAASGRCSRRSCWRPSSARGPPSRTTAACSPSCSIGLLRRRRRRAAGAVGAGHGQRAGAAQQVAGDVVVRQPDRDGALGVAEVPGQGRRVLEHQGQPAGPERLGELVRDRRQAARPGRPASTPRRSAPGTGMVRPRFLAASSPVDRGRREGVGGDAVDGVGGQQHQLAAADRGGRGVEAGGALRRGRCSRRGRPRGSESLPPAASGPAGGGEPRPAGEVGVVLDVGEPAVRADDGGQRAALLVGVLDAEPARRGAAAGRRRASIPRTTSSPSGPPHSASGGSWSATSRGSTAPSGT